MDAGERSECFISEAHSLKSALTYGINLAPWPFLNTKKSEPKLTFPNSNKTQPSSQFSPTHPYKAATL
jgi:hypothetical protein